jgi:hypothetical protein
VHVSVQGKIIIQGIPSKEILSMKNKIAVTLLGSISLAASSAAMAIPTYQIGDVDGGACNNYDSINEDCLVGGEFSLLSLEAGEAFLVISSTPKDDTTIGDILNVAPSGDEGALTLVQSGIGAPPLSDSNTLAPHGIFDTYFEVYSVNFNTAGDVYNVQDGDGPVSGFVELISLNLAAGSLLEGQGIHFDLFACTTGSMPDTCQVSEGDFAPFSHDATYVPVPAAVWLFGSGLMGLVGIARRKKVA